MEQPNAANVPRCALFADRADCDVFPHCAGPHGCGAAEATPKLPPPVLTAFSTTEQMRREMRRRGLATVAATRRQRAAAIPVENASRRMMAEALGIRIPEGQPE